MGRLVFVDGYNVIHADARLAGLLRQSLETARHALIAQLNADPRLRWDDVTVVFDGARQPGIGPAYANRGRIRVRFSRPGQSADDLIRQLVLAAGTDDILIISNDRDVRASANYAGGSAVGINRLPYRQRETPPARQTDSASDEADDDTRPTFGRKKGNPKRAPGRRTRERERNSYWW